MTISGLGTSFQLPKKMTKEGNMWSETGGHIHGFNKQWISVEKFCAKIFIINIILESF